MIKREKRPPLTPPCQGGGKHMKQRWFYIVLIIIVVVALIFLFVRQNVSSSDLEVIFLDVGQGDSHLIKTPGGQNILIDGGPDNTVLEKLAKYIPFDDTIDLMILTHPHADHVTGLIEVLNRYNVERILATGVIHTTDEYLTWLDIIRNNSIHFDQAIAPRQYIFETPKSVASGQAREPVVLEVIYPDRDIAGESFDDVNESSVVVMLSYKDKKFLFTGDISVDVEKRIINSYCHSELVSESNKTLRQAQGDKLNKNICDSLSADVLKVAHQGSDTSSDEEFLAAVKPDFAVIPVGDNDYGHPSLRIIRRIERSGVKVLRTDQLGDIVFTVNKEGKLELR
jgi:competence protein ComEC